MRLYLSSFRLGNHAHRITELVGRERPRVLAVMNALDAIAVEKRQALYARLCGDLATIGCEPHELDLREYFARPGEIGRALSGCDLVWVNGGNAFTLRAAMRQSGFDEAITSLLDADAIVYGGYSAGAVVAGPTLRGIDLVDSADPADALPLGYGPIITWEGLGLVPYAIAPHYRSDHFESKKMEDVVAYFERHGVPYWALRDGQVIVINGRDEVVLDA